ncbi:MAG: phosphate ABC transporter substrate-binding protein PstS [Candidatus Xiphinematobacter sp.]|nr:MAG: phosphate ABC transporter substrate-binding protein PstS [Candidatus Xiphinematobacter sp.]QQY09304.1 MAG: phosphate ABC transporter substrate-binding protein PstS [Candidatus Xiphinematobacter sp.]QQY11533.1 MAG: phosphate ABC transporter substrate-binding protein PstS [Candidatus Xiphinematobacter sp.]
MKFFLLVPVYWAALSLDTAVFASTEKQIFLQGIGASFPAPLYQRWIAEFSKRRPDIEVNYQAIGSGAGIKGLRRRVVDFAASDVIAPKKGAAIPKGIVTIPVIGGSVVLGYNLPGITSLRLSRKAYVDIFLGRITCWNDPDIVSTNCEVVLPDLPILVVTRSDGSGTTFAFTRHLSAISQDFKKTIGANKSVAWPTGVAGKGNDGVTTLIKQIPGAIGYMEYGYAISSGVTFPELQNKSGNFVRATPVSGYTALSSISSSENSPTDPDGGGDYPIVTFSWLLLYKTYKDAEKSRALKAFVGYALTAGQSLAAQLGYIPLPSLIVGPTQEKLAGVK